jgi:cytochrome c
MVRASTASVDVAARADASFEACVCTPDARAFRFSAASKEPIGGERMHVLNPLTRGNRMKRFRMLIGFCAAVAVMVGVASAQEHGTKDEAKAMVDSAIEHVKKVGPDQAFKDFTNDKAAWTKKDLYIFAYDMQGTCVAQGDNAKLIGRGLMDLKDPNGVAIIAEQTKIAQTKGEGWFEYIWPHPQTKKLTPKMSYVRKVPNYEGWLAVGIFK